MPKENQSYKAQRSKITASQADKLKPQKKTPRPGAKGPRYNVNRLWDTDIKGFYLELQVMILLMKILLALFF